ncbi:hypothetical protein CLV24_12182 [Pontibacter ummariensis]|uniref:Uncharacterized protein n=2 Tax=Pontibacter TaxID=323449 RepID=A0A239JF08_9BACT|nr:hypothetical protein CLV24_12182 [Pontibacter ummariensis]PVY38399.1 hypothetical protein C8E01_11799 [Pontibacter virosus]SNT04389.1 hypothetical protein SAMN06296052_12182 [Pontibacter ummariensis]
MSEGFVNNKDLTKGKRKRLALRKLHNFFTKTAKI